MPLLYKVRQLLNKFLLILLLLFGHKAPAQVQSEFTENQELHFFASYALNATVVQMLPKSKHRLLYSTLISVSLGALKEMADTKFDKDDMEADVVGAGTYAFVHYAFRF